VELICSCSFEGDKAPGVGFEELLTVGGHSSIGFFVGSINYDACEFSGFPGDFVRDLDTMNALNFIDDINRCHIRL